MSNWIKVESFSLDEDLGELAAFLQAHRMPCRFSEENNCQVLWTSEQSLAEPLRELVRKWRDGGAQLEMPQAQIPVAVRQPFCPLTILLILLSLAGAALVTWGPELLVGQFTAQPIVEQGGVRYLMKLSYALEAGQWWRLWTPAFLHFGILHIVFNSLWLWVLGRQLETGTGWRWLLGIFLWTALVSNLAQYWWEPESIFGGMSGVVYGFIGFLLPLQRRGPRWAYLPPGLIIFMLGWLVVCGLGIVDIFIDGSVANAAHTGGLLAGIVAGLLYGALYRPRNGRNTTE